MAASSTNSFVFSIKISDKITHCWYGQEYQYKDLGTDLGVKSTKPGESLPETAVFGGNNKPPRISLRTNKGKSFTRFIAADKIEKAVHENNLIGKKLKDKAGVEHKICSVSIKSN